MSIEVRQVRVGYEWRWFENGKTGDGTILGGWAPNEEEARKRAKHAHYDYRFGDSDDPDVVTDGGLIERCPECESADISPRNLRSDTMGENMLRGDKEANWRCGQCQARFDEPDRSEPRGSRKGGSTEKKLLLEADPDDHRPADMREGGESA